VRESLGTDKRAGFDFVDCFLSVIDWVDFVVFTFEPRLLSNKQLNIIVKCRHASGFPIVTDTPLRYYLELFALSMLSMLSRTGEGVKRTDRQHDRQKDRQ